MHRLKNLECVGIIFQTLSLKAHDILKYVYGRRINSLESIGLQSRGVCVASIVAAVRGQRGTCSAMGPSTGEDGRVQ